MAARVSVRGYRETVRALDTINRDAKKAVLRSLALAAEPVAADARQKLGRYAGASLTTIRPRATVRGVFVTQMKRKVTGLRGDFGSIQMREGLLPALDENEGKIIVEVELALDRLGASQGF
jgi:hypothetical protein